MKQPNQPKAQVKARQPGSGNPVTTQAPQDVRTPHRSSLPQLAPSTAPSNPNPRGDASIQPKYNDGVSRYDQARYVVTDPLTPPPTDGARVKMDLSRRNNANLISFVETHISMMTANPNFAAPSPQPADLQASLTDLQQKSAAADTAYAQYQDLVSARDASRTTLESMMRRRGAYVQDASNGNRQVILSSGLETNNARTPVGNLPPPTMLHTELNGTAGVIRLTWLPIPRARGYIVQCSEDVTPRAWELEGSTGKARFEKQFRPGQTYVFRVATEGTNGLSYWSPEIVRGAA